MTCIFRIILILLLPNFVFSQCKLDKHFNSIEIPSTEFRKQDLYITLNQDINYFDSVEIKKKSYNSVSVLQTTINSNGKVDFHDTILTYLFDSCGKATKQVIFSQYPNDTTDLIEWMNKIKIPEWNIIYKCIKNGDDSIFYSFELMDNKIDTAIVVYHVQNKFGQLTEFHSNYTPKYEKLVGCSSGAHYNYIYKYDSIGRVVFKGIPEGYYIKFNYNSKYISVEEYDNIKDTITESKYLIENNEYFNSLVTSKNALIYKYIDSNKKLPLRISYIDFLGFSENYDFIYHE